MKRVSTFIIAILTSILSMGQTQQTGSFTLEQCIQYALENAIRSKNANLDQAIASAKVKETIGIGLPQISGSANLTHNQQLPRFFMMYQPGGFIDFSGVPGIQPGDVVAAQNFFQLKSSASASFGLDQLIFNGSYLVGLKASNTFKELAVRTTEATQQDIIQQVTKAYYAVLINRERTTLFDNNISRVDSLLRNTTALHQNGFAESIDVDRVKVTLNNLRAERDKFLNLNELGLQLLKFQMNYPQDQPIEVLGSIQNVKVDTDLEHYKEGWDYTNRPDYKVLVVNRRLQELTLKNQYATIYPVISAFGNLGMSTQSPNISGLFKTNSTFSDEGGAGPDKWYNYSNYGLNLSIPIFTGLSRTYRIQQEKIRLSQIDNNFIGLRNSINFEIAQGSAGFENALLSLTAQRENQELAANVARVTKTKYEHGVGSSLEVTDAENALVTAQINYYSALFDAMIAKVDLDKAYGLLLPSTYEKNSLINPENK